MAEETLFTDIINTLGKAKKEGKISGGYRYKDGKLNIGGGYYGDDSMLEIDVNKDGGNILFKKRFKDGGSTNGSGDKAFTGKVKELMDDGYEFGEAVKEAMRQGYNKGGQVVMEAMIQKLYTDFGQALVDSESLKKHGKSIRDITSDQRGNLKRRLEKFKSFIKENNRMPSETEARVAGRKDKAVTDAVGKDGKGITEDKIRKNMIKKGKTVQMNKRSGKTIFADPKIQKQFTEDLTKRYLIAKNSTKAGKANILLNKDFYDKYFKGYSQSSVRTIIGNYKKAMDLEYVKLSPAEKTVSNTNRILAEIITQGGKRFSGTKTSQVHHLFPLGDKYVKASGRNFAIIDRRTNAGMSNSNKILKSLVKERVALVDNKLANKITLEEFNTKNNEINKRATETINTYNNKNPQNKGLLNWRKLSIGSNSGEVIRNESIGGDYKSRAFDPKNKTLIENLDPKGLREYRQLIAKKANINDLKKIPGVTTANEIQQPEKSKIRSMFDKFNVANVYKNVRPGIDKFTTMFPGKADNALAAAIDFPMMYMSGLPVPAAAASAASMFLNKPNLGKGINIALESAALTDEERFLKKANERKEGIETILRNAPRKAKNYLMNSKRTRPVRYGNIEDYLPDGDFSGIKSLK